MSALTAVDAKATKKPQYKDYVTFLGSYRSGKKDDQCSVATNDSGVGFSLNNSSNNSSSSVNSDLGEQPRNGFKEYLEHYNNKKYSSVQPAFIKKQKPEETKTVKTEVYIEINNQNGVSQVQKVVEINCGQNQASNVSKVSKLFEKNSVSNPEPVAVKTVPSGKVNTFKFEQKEPEVQPAKQEQEVKKTSIGEISKKFESNSNGTLQKIPLKKTNSISEKSKLFEDINQTEAKKDLAKPKETTKLPRTNGTTSPKPPINNTKPAIAPKIFQESSVPPPPPPPFQNVVPPQHIPCPPPQPPSNAPPPPPLPPANPTPKISSKPTPITQKTLTNGPNTAPSQNGKKVDVVDGIPVPVINKNDPRVKRMVYGALREMYGAYHDKANDYIATLPRNRVKKNNGLDSIINSIASQGGLEKLNGRVNPTVENE